MRILPISFNSNYKTNKINQNQTRPISLKADTVEFGKNLSFKGELKSEEEILSFDGKAQKESSKALEDVSKMQKELAQELEKVKEIKKQIALRSLVLFRNHELIIGHDSIKYRIRETENGPYDEYEFDLDAKIKTISKGVRNTDKMGQEIDERYTFDENQNLKLVEYYFKSVPVRKTKKDSSSDLVGGYASWNSRYRFSNGKLASVCYMTTYNVSERYRTKEYLRYENDKLAEYTEDQISGNFGFKYAQGIKYSQEDGTFEYAKGFSNTKKGIEFEQISSFKDGKLINTKIG